MDILDSEIEYDIKSAALRQGSFYYQVSLDHFRNPKFLDDALTRYKMFLYLKQKYPDQFLVPCYDNDLIWHTHQVSTLHYAKDTIGILGKILPHDDSVNERSKGSKFLAFLEQGRRCIQDNIKSLLKRNQSTYHSSHLIVRVG